MRGRQRYYTDWGLLQITFPYVPYFCVGLEELAEPVKQEQRIHSSKHVIKLEQENSLRSDLSFGLTF